jgi:hypothetical protein
MDPDPSGTIHSKSSCKHAAGVAYTDAPLTPSFAREGVARPAV